MHECHPELVTRQLTLDAEEITESLNGDLGPGDRPFEPREVASWLRGAHDEVLSLYWLQSRPRR